MFLHDIESAIWQMLIRVACGSSAEEELQGLFSNFDALQPLYSLKDQELSWFMKGIYSYCFFFKKNTN